MVENKTILESCETQPAARKEHPLQGLVNKLYGMFDIKIFRLSFVLTLVAVALILPNLTSRYFMEVMTNAWFYIVVCLGLNIIVGFAGLLSLGYAAFFAVGAYTTGILSSHFEINFWLTLPLSAMAAVIAGVVIGGPTLRDRKSVV